ncbi:hypothetical protein PIB30_032139 [Stylosanthes scabra]|uniref:Uncharacterized protein n=1 Tax=Stylosanthes scabra TaxID=79078 RepID=A0ABU6XDK6_9FABA|nr:hypothetical protein [Stylosanthes scabra]
MLANAKVWGTDDKAPPRVSGFSLCEPQDLQYHHNDPGCRPCHGRCELSGESNQRQSGRVLGQQDAVGRVWQQSHRREGQV